MTGPTDIPGGNGKTDVTIDFDDPLYSHPLDTFVTTIITIKLMGNENFRLLRFLYLGLLKPVTN